MAETEADPESEAASEVDDVEAAREDIEFQLPEFDEASYIRQEIRDARLAVGTLAWAAVVAVLTRAVQTAVGNLAWAFLFGLLGMYGLRPVVRVLGASLEDLEAKNWLGLGAVYFFSWLGFWTLLLNEPFI